MKKTKTVVTSNVALALLTCALCFPNKAFAGTYWVSADGTAAWAACEGTTPLDGVNACSLASANSNAVAGDTVNLRAGTYSGQTIEPESSGTSDNDRVIFTNYADEEVTINDSPYGIYIYFQSHITVNGIRFVNLRRFMRIYASHYITISYCDFDTRSPDSGDWAGAIIADDYADNTPASENSTHNWVHHCTFYRWVYGAYDEHRGALLNLGTDQSEGDDSSYNLIEDNIFAYGGHHTIGVYSQFNVIRNNYIHNETNPANWNFEGYRGAITEGPSAGRCLYEGNRFGFSDGSGLALRTSYNILRFNQFYHNGSGGIQVVANNPANGDQADYNYIYHNTFFHNGHLATYSGFQGGMYFSNWGGLDPLGNVVKNNIFYDNRNGSVTYDGNFALPVIESNWDDNSVDPGFVDLSGNDPDNAILPDLHLVPTSPAKDQGAWLTTITSAEGTGNSFTVTDANYFMDGWTIVEGDLIQLEGQTQRVRITQVDYGTNTITVDTSLSFTIGQGVGLAYVDTARDQGAFEIGLDTIPDGGGPNPGDGGPPGADGGITDGDGGSNGGGEGDKGCNCRSHNGQTNPFGLIIILIIILALHRKNFRARN